MKRFDLANIFSNPNVIGGLNTLAPIGAQGLVQAEALKRQQAEAQGQQQEFQMKQQEALRNQRMQAILPQILKELDPNDSMGSFHKLTQGGVDPKLAAVVIKNLSEIGQKPKGEYFEGADKRQYEIVTNPETGEREARALPGQALSEAEEGVIGVPAGLSKAGKKLWEAENIKAQFKPPMTPADKAFNNKILHEASAESKSAKEINNSLKSMYEAFEKFDDLSGSKTRAGGHIHGDLIPQGLTNFALDPKQRAQAQIISKSKGALAREMFKGGLGRALGANTEEELLKALPGLNLEPEARNHILYELSASESKKILKNQFYNEWRKQNQGDMNGADIAYDSFLAQTKPLDTQGFINPGIEKFIPELVKEIIGNENNNDQVNYDPDMQDRNVNDFQSDQQNQIGNNRLEKVRQGALGSGYNGL